MTARTWHGVVQFVDGKVQVVKVYADVPTIFHGKLAPEAPKRPTPPAPAKNGEPA